MANRSVATRAAGWALAILGGLVIVGAVAMGALWLLMDMSQSISDAPQKGGHTAAEFNRALLGCIGAALVGAVMAVAGGRLARRE